MSGRRILVVPGVDGLGRSRFTIEWTEPNGVFRPELGKDGAPVGYRRGQCFHAKLSDHQRPGDQIVEVEA